MINFTTGPIDTLPFVSDALRYSSISHRSIEFVDLYHEVSGSISEKLNVRETYLFSGSGTLANDVMIAQIGLRKEKGLILANGEFGERLIQQAGRQRLDFNVLKTEWGSPINVAQIVDAISLSGAKWLLLCHCETSTGFINPLNEIIENCASLSCDIYLDCMSTIGVIDLNLADVAMATASSGKGIGSYAGIALVLCNTEIISSSSVPLYLDLAYMKDSNGIPFTMLSNLLIALSRAVSCNLNENRYRQLSDYSSIVFSRLDSLNLIPFSTVESRVFTIVPEQKNVQNAIKYLSGKDISLSFQSRYLQRHNWFQMALFGTYTSEEIEYGLTCIEDAFIHA